MTGEDKVIFKNGVYYYKNSWKQRIGNMTKVYVKGTDDDRGFQFGKLMAAEIKSVIKAFFTFEMAKSGFPLLFRWVFRWMPFLFCTLLHSRFGERVRENIEKYPAWMVKELEGMARGAKVNPFYLKFLNTVNDDKNALGDKELNALNSRSCCSFAFTGNDGQIYHGKNLDWVLIEGYIDLLCLQQREDEKGNWFSIIGPPGLLNGYEYGMNSHGISIGLTGRFYRGKRASRLVLTNALELKILRCGKNLKEIRDMYKTGTGFNRTDALLICSAADKGYELFEVTPKGVAKTSAENGMLFNTNTYVNKVFHPHNKQWGTIYENRFRDPRYLRLQEMMANNPQDLEDAFAILADSRQPGFEHQTFLGQATINRFITHVSALVVHGEIPGVWIARDRAYAAYNEYIFFDFSARPQKNMQKRPANDIIYTKKFKTFKDFMHLRESRYYISPKKLLRAGKKLVEKEPFNPIFILFTAQNYLKYRQFDLALTLLKDHPIEWCADYWYCLGRCYQGQGRYENSRECFSKAMTLPPIDGFPELVQTVCLIQLVKVNTALNLTHEVNRLKEEIKKIQSKFATPYIGMPDYPYINNINEQMEEIVH